MIWRDLVALGRGEIWYEAVITLPPHSTRRHLPELSRRLDAVAPDYKERSVY